MKGEMESYLKKFGVFKIGVADPKQGFEMAREGCRPRDVMNNCESVIVFALHVGLDYYTTLDYFQNQDVESRVLSIHCTWVASQLANFIRDRNYNALVPHGFKSEKGFIAHLSFKLAAYEAGLGVFGRPSVLITPEYGPRVNFGVVLTDASIQFNKPLKSFSPCKQCDICVRVCPINAIDNKLAPPKGFDRSRCLKFMDRIREKTKKRIRYCGYCYNHCPVGGISKKTFHLSRWKTLLDIDQKERRKLLKNIGSCT